MQMSQLYVHNKPIESIFELLGSDENDITYSVGWALHSSPAFLRRFLRETIGFRGNLDEVTIRLQEYERNKGITDIEISKPGKFRIIVEAKKSWSLPRVSQVKKYAARLRNRGNENGRIIVLSGCSAKYAEEHLRFGGVARPPAKALSWKQVARMASEAFSKSKHREKLFLGEMLGFLRRVVTVQNQESNWVYVFSLDATGIRNMRRTKTYFHRVSGARKESPNYLAFRYHGKLQSIHHVEKCESVNELELKKRGYELSEPPKKGKIHVLYKLGRDIRPPNEIKSGKIWNRRVRCMFDTLLTCKTIADAAALSLKRSKMCERMGR